MPIQFTRKRLFSLLLLGTLALGIGNVTIQPAAAQHNRSAMRQTARELNLSRSQMFKIAGIMRDFRSEMKDILTPEQFELLQSTQQQQSTTEPQEVRDALALTGTQSTQLASAREDMLAELQGVLTPSQFTKMMKKVSFNPL